MKILSYIFRGCFFVLLIGCCSGSYAQSDWVNYLVEKEKGLMSIHVDLSLNISKPLYKKLLIVGTNYKKDCFKNGFPKEKGSEKLYRFSDSVATTINKSTKYKLAGVLTYKCYGFDVYYVKDTLDLRKNINNMISRSFESETDNYILIQDDNKWTYYYNIFPSNWPNDFFINHEYLMNMVSQGDDLTQERTVHHWINFKKEKRRLKYADKLKKIGFAIDSLNFKNKTPYPFELQISRKESVEPESINHLTKSLKASALSYFGKYDGWSTEPIVE